MPPLAVAPVGASGTAHDVVTMPLDTVDSPAAFNAVTVYVYCVPAAMVASLYMSTLPKVAITAPSL